VVVGATRRHSSARKRGKVVRQSPAAGRRLQNGAKVNVTVGRASPGVSREGPGGQA